MAFDAVASSVWGKFYFIEKSTLAVYVLCMNVDIFGYMTVVLIMMMDVRILLKLDVKTFLCDT